MLCTWKKMEKMKVVLWRVGSVVSIEMNLVQFYTRDVNKGADKQSMHHWCLHALICDMMHIHELEYD